MGEPIIGRQKEMEDLREWINSDRSEFIAIYGRRRVGKTFLIKKTVGDDFTFHFSGTLGFSRTNQLLNFGLTLREQSRGLDIPIPENWIVAFHLLKQLIENSPHKHKIIFLDELPWIDTPKSGFIPALENFWNSWCSWRDDIKLIVCGSATSWIINKIIKNKGGLHNRLTHHMQVNPFDLRACEEYFDTYNFGYNRMQIAECYMTMGGIPYYFSLMKRGDSVSQNIDFLFFGKDAPLKNEFEDLYKALFKNYKNYIIVIKALGDKGLGLTRREILDKTQLINNGEFSKILTDLELCGFIRSYLPFENSYSYGKNSSRKSRNILFQLVDFYTLFYLHFQKQAKTSNEKFWESNYNTPLLNTWRGLTFEMLCLCHTAQIKKALGIGDVSSNACSWRGRNDSAGTQIDLLLDRNDHTINLCEMKFSFKETVIDKEYAEKLQNKVAVFMEETSTSKNILLTMITTKGIKKNNYSHVVQRHIELDELYAKV